MVLQVATDRRRIPQHANPERLQQRTRGQFPSAGRTIGECTAPAARMTSPLAEGLPLQPRPGGTRRRRRAPASNPQAVDKRAGLHLQVAASQRRVQEGPGVAAATAVAKAELVQTNPFLGRSVEVGVVRKAKRAGAGQRLLHHRVLAAADARDLPRPAGPAVRVGALVVILRHPEVGQDVVVTPADVAARAPSRRSPHAGRGCRPSR